MCVWMQREGNPLTFPFTVLSMHNGIHTNTALRRARTGVDSRGLDYGACSHPGCLCSGCQSVPGARKCSVCSHPLMRHKAVGSSWKPGVNSDMKIAWTTVTRFRTDSKLYCIVAFGINDSPGTWRGRGSLKQHCRHLYCVLYY